MRIVLKLLVATATAAACAWAPPLHGQARTDAHAQATQPATHAPVSAMGRAMAALLDQASRAQARPPQAQATAAPPDTVAIDTHPVAAAQDARIAEDGSPGQVVVH